MERIKSDLIMVIKLFDWTHISRRFLESNIKPIKRVEGIQNYKLSELMVKKLQHDCKKVTHNFSSYHLSDTEKLVHKYNSFTNMPQLFDQSNRQLVLQHTIFQNSLYQFLKNLLLMNII